MLILTETLQPLQGNKQGRVAKESNRPTLQMLLSS